MILESKSKPYCILPDMSSWNKIDDQDRQEILTRLKLFCPPVLWFEIYNDFWGSIKRLKHQPEYLGVRSWQTLMKHELAGGSVTDKKLFEPDRLRLISNMGPEEKGFADRASEFIGNLDSIDRDRYQHPATLKNLDRGAFIKFANSPYKSLTNQQFMQRYEKVTKGTIFEVVVNASYNSKKSLNEIREYIEQSLNEYKQIFSLDNFERSFMFAEQMLDDSFFEMCDDIFIPLLTSVEDDVEFDMQKWEETKRRYENQNVAKIFPYSWYAFHLYLGLHLYQVENDYNKRVTTRDFEYLYYLFFNNVLFVSSDVQHKKYITESGIFQSRRYGSFAYLPDKNEDPQEYHRVIRYLKNGTLY